MEVKMKRNYKLTDVDCANCAAKMETAINKIDGVDNATVNFLSRRLIIEVDEDRMDEILEKAQKAVSKIDRHCTIER